MNILFYGLGLLFIALKLTGYIAWSWWLVLMPFIIYWGVLWVLVIFTLSSASKKYNARKKRFSK